MWDKIRKKQKRVLWVICNLAAKRIFVEKKNTWDFIKTSRQVDFKAIKMIFYISFLWCWNGGFFEKLPTHQLYLTNCAIKRNLSDVAKNWNILFVNFITCWTSQRLEFDTWIFPKLYRIFKIPKSTVSNRKGPQTDWEFILKLVYFLSFFTANNNGFVKVMNNKTQGI
jgi:hypothetical protein